MRPLSISAQVRLVLAHAERPLSFDTIASRLPDVSRQVIRSSLHSLITQGVARKTRAGRYGLDRTPRSRPYKYPKRDSAYDTFILAALLIAPASARQLAEALAGDFPSVRLPSLQTRITQRLAVLKAEGKVTHDNRPHGPQPRLWSLIK